MANQPKVAHDARTKVQEGRPTGEVNRPKPVQFKTVKPGYIASRNIKVPK